MASDVTNPKLPAEESDDKSAAPVSVRFSDRRLKKLVRKAAAELDKSRSEFMAEAAVQAARTVLKLQREEDFQKYLEAA